MRSRTHCWPAFLLPLLLACSSPDPQSSPTGASGDEPRLQALHVAMRDDTLIAIDLWLPEALAPGQTVPTLMRMTRYWRAEDRVGADPEADSNYETASALGAAGYAYVIVDARGTGASFGTRPYVTTEDEVRDYGEIADWIAAQPWSNGRVGSFGVSYDGTTAEMLATNHSPAVKAVAPLYPDFSAYEHLIRPGNVSLGFFLDAWGAAVWKMDNNDICGLQGVEGEACAELKSRVRGVKPVDADTNGALLDAAVADHQTNVRVADAARDLEFADDRFGDGPPRTMEVSSPAGKVAELATSGVAYFSRVGWLDAATVAGALSRFNTLPNPQKVVIGALSHGGGHDTDPFRDPDDDSPDPTTDRQLTAMLEFFDHYLKGEREADPLPSEITYMTLGSRQWHTTPVWPPEGLDRRELFLGAEGTLREERPASTEGSDVYRVDYTASTGTANRWRTNMGGGDVVYPDRRAEDRKLLTYTSEPMESDVEITGHPLLTLFVRSTHEDGAFFGYLEVVAPDGRVTYVTEGQLRAVSRKVSSEEPPYHYYGPYRTLSRADAESLVPGEVAELTFELWPTSVLVRAGHRVRIALAGADAGNFDRYPPSGDPVITVERNAEYPSKIVLPMAER